jgi:hypothetical protein
VLVGVVAGYLASETRRYVMPGEVETYYEDGEWRNAIVPGEDIGGPYGSRDEAVASGREAARERGVEHVVRDEQGTVVEHDSLGG